jgi:hypothetical protein
MTFRTEFPDFDPTTMPAIPADWEDISWHNDACPSFKTPNGYTVWIDYADETQREFNAGERFGILDANGDEVHATDNFEVIKSLVKN